MRHFKTAIIATGVAFVLAIGGGAYGMYLIHKTGKSNSEKRKRAELLGSGIGTLTCIVIAPFWLVAAARVGKERRAAKEKKAAAAVQAGEE